MADKSYVSEPIDLPSKGKFYPTDSPLRNGKVDVKYMTAKEEDILTNQNLLKQGRALDKLYESLIIGNGEGQPVNIDDMIVGDKSAIMIATRVLGYGADYEISLTHPDSGKQFKHTVDLTDLKPKQVDLSLYKNSRELEYTLPISKKVIVFKIRTTREESEIAREVARQEKAGISKPITTALKYCIVSIDGETDKQFISKFIDNDLLARDSLELRKFILTVTPDYDLTIRVTNKENNYDQDITLPIDVNFFWPRV